MIEGINPAYQHQLYFFTYEAEEVRSYFQNLIKVDINNNNNNNVHLSDKLIDYKNLTQKICIFTKKSEFHNKIERMITTDEALKIIVALLFKGFGWRNEIYESFNISSNLYVQNTLGTLLNLKLLYKEKGFKLNQYYFEAIKKIKNQNLRKGLHQADILFINEKFIEFCSTLKELFEHKINSDPTFKFSLKSIIQDSMRFRIEIDRIMEEENNLFSRVHHEGDLIYETETLKSKTLKKSVKQSILEVKKEMLLEKQQKGLLTAEDKNNLVLIEEQSRELAVYNPEILDFHQNKRVTTTYKGKVIDEDILEKQKKIDAEIEKAPIEFKSCPSINEIKKFKKESDELKPKESFDDQIIRVNALIKFILAREKVTADRVFNNILSDEAFDYFKNKCLHHNIKYDYEYFFVENKSAKEQVDDFFNGLKLEVSK